MTLILLSTEMCGSGVDQVSVSGVDQVSIES